MPRAYGHIRRLFELEHRSGSARGVLQFCLAFFHSWFICTVMELGPQNQNKDDRVGANSIMVVYIDPLSLGSTWCCGTHVE